MLCAGVMELADVSDSKSDGSDTVPVRPRSPAPGEQVLVSRACFFIRVLILFCLCFTTKSIGDDLGLTVLSDKRKRPSEPSEPAERKTNRLKRPEKCLCEQISVLCELFSFKRVCCHCGARHNDDMDLCGTVCRCSNRLRASGTHQYCALTKS